MIPMLMELSSGTELNLELRQEAPVKMGSTSYCKEACAIHSELKEVHQFRTKKSFTVKCK